MMYIIFAIISQIFAIFGAFYLKKGAKKSIINKKIIYGIFLYGISTIFFVIALKLGKLSSVYPFVSLSYIGVTLLGAKYLNEKMSKKKIIGLTIIILGIIIIGIAK